MFISRCSDADSADAFAASGLARYPGVPDSA
jgi:hypothetical protein